MKLHIKNKKITAIISFLGTIVCAGFIIGIGGWFGGGASIPADTMTRGLVGYWSFGEGFGDTAYDGSGNANHGSLGAGVAANKPNWTTANPPAGGGGALSFDGVNDYVDAGSGTSLNVGASDFTIEAWVNPSVVVGSIGMVATKGAIDNEIQAGNESYALRLGSNKFEFALQDADEEIDVYSNNTQTTNTWYHLVGVADRDGLSKLYVNGVLQTDQKNISSVGNLDNTNPFRMGSYTNNPTYANFYGLIDEVRIYNRALSAEEIRYHYNRGGPVAQWKFDEGSGTTAYDSTENNNDGTLSGFASPPTSTSGWTTGKYGTALSFDGDNDYVNAGSGASLKPDVFSVEAWVKYNAGGFFPVAVWDADFAPGVYVKYTAAWTEPIIILNSGNYKYFQEGNLWDGNWHHIVFIVIGNAQNDILNSKFYVDAQEKAGVVGAVANSNAPLAKSDLIMGGNNYSHANGLIDDVRIYNYARTADEIRLDYNAGFAAKIGGTWDFDQGQVGYWAMNEGTGQYAYDGSGNNNTGTLGSGSNPDSADPTWTTGKSAGALSFDGVDDYVNAGSGASLNITDAITIEAWAYAKILTWYGGIASNQGGGTFEGFMLGYRYGYWYFSVGNGVTRDLLAANSEYQVNTWYHVVGVRRSGTNYLYVNGVQQSATGVLTPVASNLNWLMGRYFSNYDGYYFNGLIDEVRIYNRALSAEEIRYHYNRGGPVAQWKFDEGSGTIAHDTACGGQTSPQCHHGTIYSAPTDCPTGWIPVPGNPLYGTTGFCVMKYKAKCAGSAEGDTCNDATDIPASQAANKPWRTTISQIEAIAACVRAGGHLLTDNEAQTINRNIEQVNNNWCELNGSGCGNTPGTKYLAAGHNDAAWESPYNYCLAAYTDDSLPCYGTKGTGSDYNPTDTSVCGAVGGTQKRTHTLSNGEVIWDWAGDVWEWIYGDGTDGQIDSTGGVSWRSSNNWQEWNIVDLNEERPILGPSNSSWTATQGIGRYYGGVSTNAFLRGGSWVNGVDAGGFALYLGYAPTNTGSYVGFRCAR